LLGEVRGARVAVLGVAFKPDSDDVRDSPALDVARRLHAAGADVVVHDPEANETAARLAPDLTYVGDVPTALRDAELVLVLTEWAQFKALRPADVVALVSRRRIVDARNVFDPAEWREAGFEFRGLGRP
jgi:UDPglucose 6-dehydrogenase